MRAKSLSTVWGAPDNSRLTKKQMSIRLPVLVAAQVEAILEMFPRRSRTEVIGDLLAAALRDFEEGLESRIGELKEVHPYDDKRVFYDAGPKGRFRDCTNKHLERLENELGNEHPELLPDATVQEDEGDF